MKRRAPEELDAPTATAIPENLSEAHRSGFVTLFGRSNVGKSTLLNQLVGKKLAIVTDVPQTTRRRVRGVRTYADAQIIYMDTPGIHKPRFMMNRRMLSTALASLEGVDLLLVIIDGAAGLGPGDRFAFSLTQDCKVPVFLVINKIDLLDKEALLGVIQAATGEFSFAEVVPVSAETGENVDRLESLIRQRLPLGPQYFPQDAATDAPEKFLLAETLREKIILNTKQELPHSTAVVLERLEEKKDILEMDALVVVERQSQKGILIGRNGETMKRIATAARQEMEARLGVKIFLQVWVKVARNWRMDERLLDHLGVEHASPQQPAEKPEGSSS